MVPFQLSSGRSTKQTLGIFNHYATESPQHPPPYLKSILGGECTRLWVSEFPWGEPPTSYGLAPPYDMVLAADCIYDVKQVAIFLQSLRCVGIYGGG